MCFFLFSLSDFVFLPKVQIYKCALKVSLTSSSKLIGGAIPVRATRIFLENISEMAKPAKGLLASKTLQIGNKHVWDSRPF